MSSVSWYGGWHEGFFHMVSVCQSMCPSVIVVFWVFVLLEHINFHALHPDRFMLARCAHTRAPTWLGYSPNAVSYKWVVCVSHIIWKVWLGKIPKIIDSLILRFWESKIDFKGKSNSIPVLSGCIHIAAKFGCLFTFQCLILFCTHTVQ